MSIEDVTLEDFLAAWPPVPPVCPRCASHGLKEVQTGSFVDGRALSYACGTRVMSERGEPWEVLTTTPACTEQRLSLTQDLYCCPRCHSDVEFAKHKRCCPSDSCEENRPARWYCTECWWETFGLPEHYPHQKVILKSDLDKGE